MPREAPDGQTEVTHIMRISDARVRYERSKHRTRLLNNDLPYYSHHQISEQIPDSKNPALGRHNQPL